MAVMGLSAVWMMADHGPNGATAKVMEQAGSHGLGVILQLTCRWQYTLPLSGRARQALESQMQRHTLEKRKISAT